MKRTLSALLALALILGICGGALADEDVTARTPLAGSSQARIANIELAASRINSITLGYGERFSFNEIVGPRTGAYGFQTAVNGRGVKVTGGGVAQVASTLYLALCQLGDDIEFDEKHTYGDKFTGSYVSDSDDAILVDEASGLDFSFINYGDDLYIEMWTTDSYVYCALSSVEIEDYTLDWAQVIPSADLMRSPIASASIDVDGTDALRENILLAAGSINDTVLASGDLFSFNDSVGPRSEKYGYQSALNGRGVEVVGGGVAQVASVIWLAVKNLDCVAIVEKSTYGSRYNQSYVASSNDAILTDYTGGTDFSFRNTGEEALTISTYLSGNTLYCDIYQG